MVVTHHSSYPPQQLLISVEGHCNPLRPRRRAMLPPYTIILSGEGCYSPLRRFILSYPDVGGHYNPWAELLSGEGAF